ncbi:VQ motif-containing protein 25 [Solanum tuberosum]|uniref:VQ motif-containing protein n=2 Tax=Solanum tuberosum TaxID=4113 RepID=M1C6S1_SOLTU|nr:PREDICTED: VQ motif-containing protein 25 [Solanum tuberosum]
MMYNITQKQNQISRTSPSTPLNMLNKNSQNISKLKPKIRIIHIFAPEIIKTDAANFRELVQRLTGKPSEIKKRSRIGSTKKLVPKKLELIKGGYNCNYPSELIMREKIKGEEQEDIWRNANYGGGFLGGFQEFDGFMQDFNQIPLLPLDTNNTTNNHLDGYGESPLAIQISDT